MRQRHVKAHHRDIKILVDYGELCCWHGTEATDLPDKLMPFLCLINIRGICNSSLQLRLLIRLSCLDYWQQTRARACILVSDQDHEISGCGETSRNEELGADCLLVEGTVDLALEVPGPCLSEDKEQGRWLEFFPHLLCLLNLAEANLASRDSKE